MTRYRGRLQYDGTAFQGYQRQRDGVPTVQGALEAALARISGAPVTVYGAGRTDAGVHASGQVIAFDLAWSHGAEALMRAVNANLPESVVIAQLAPTDDDFQPRFGAMWREYAYTLVVSPHRLPLMRHRAWVVHYPLDVERMDAAAAQISGERDWGALGTPPQGDNTVRHILRSLFVWERGGSYPTAVYTIRANAFMYRMVRRTVGMLVDVGRGKLTLSAMQAIIDRAVVTSTVPIAPPQGLVLTQVAYPSDEKTEQLNQTSNQVGGVLPPQIEVQER